MLMAVARLPPAAGRTDRRRPPFYQERGRLFQMPSLQTISVRVLGRGLPVSRRFFSRVAAVMLALAVINGRPAAADEPPAFSLSGR